MKKRRTPIVILLLLLVATLACGILSACRAKPGDTAPVDQFVPSEQSGVKVVFELEGGKYRNSERAVRVYYNFPEGAVKKIKPFTEVFKESLERPGYTLVGWYRTKVESEYETTYADPWDFETDVLPEQGEGSEALTLYASWDKNVKYTYNVSYLTDGGEEKLINSYLVEEGEVFEDWKVSSYTLYTRRYPEHTVCCKLGEGKQIKILYYSDAQCTTPWDPAFTHPGGDESTAIKVYVKFMQGAYTYATNYDQIRRAENGSNIYLLDDIDMTGVKNFYGFQGTQGGTFKSIFKGNGHTISNITLATDGSSGGAVSDPEIDASGNTLIFSLFGNLEGATVENLHVEGITISANGFDSRTRSIYVSPLCVKAKNSTVRDVTVSGTYQLTGLPNSLQSDPVVIDAVNKIIQPEGSPSSIENVTINFTERTEAL